MELADFIAAHKAAFIAIAFVCLCLFWLGWMLSGPSREEKQEERRRLEQEARRQAMRAQERDRLSRLKGQQSGRSVRIVPLNRKGDRGGRGNVA